MKYLLVLTTALLSTFKVTFQSSFAKKGVKTFQDSAFFNMLIFTVASVLFFPYLFTVSSSTWIYAFLYALCNVAFQITYAKALSTGNVSFAVMFANLGMIMPIILSFFAFDDNPSIIRIVGIGFTVCAFLVTVTPSKRDKKTKKTALVFALLSALTNGLGLSVQKVFGKMGNSANLGFVSASYLLCALFSALIYLIFSKKGVKKTFIINKHAIISAIGAGVSLAIFLATNTYATKVIDASFHYPAHSGCAILLSTISGVVLFKDKLTTRQIIAFTLGFLAIVLMNF